MTVENFTPGPWKAIQNGYYHDIVAGATPGKKTIQKYDPSFASVIKNDTASHTRGESTEIANALLIAASPTLYAALKQCREALRENLSKYDYKNEAVMLSALKSADKALKKAIGGK